MTRAEFEAIRNLPDKTIQDDITWQPKPGSGPNLIFREIEVQNTMDLPIVLNGSFNPWFQSVVYNFVLRGTGPICRVEVNGIRHGEAGRTYKQDLHSPEDPRSRLPHATARPDLEGKSARDLWTVLCRQANIRHLGIFNDPR